MEEDISTDLTVLQSCLDEMLDKVEQDKQILKQYHKFQLRLLSLNDLSEVIEHILTELVSFFNLDDISLSLVDENGKITHYLSNSEYKSSNNVILLEDKLILRNELANGSFVGGYDHNKHQVFFPSREEKPTVVALFPLNRRGQYLGSLNLASKHQHHFVHSTKMELGEQIVSSISLALENCFNFETVKQVQLQETLAVVNNRQYLEQRLKEELDRSQRRIHCISCLLVDIKIPKNRKISNMEKLEAYVMKTVAQLIKQQLRITDVFSYYEEKKFAALLTDVSETVVIEVEERIKKLLSEHSFKFAGQSFSILTTFGYASQTIEPEHKTTSETVALQLISEANDNLDTKLSLAEQNIPTITSSRRQTGQG